MKPDTFLPLGGLALCCLCPGAAAQSNLVMYGAVDAALAYTSNQQGKSNTYMRSGNKDGSRLGFRGAEDLGGGTELVFTLEAGVNLDDGGAAQSGSLFNRQAFVGLSDKKLGTLTAGRQYAPYFTFLAPLGPLPVVTGAAGAAAGDIDGLSIIIRNSNALVYMSPDWRGARLGLMAAAGEQAGHQGSGGALSAALKVDAAHWRFGLGYQLLKNGQQQATWDPAASSNFARSPVNAGYLSARDVQYLAGAVRYQAGALGLGGTLSNVQYRANAAARFSDTAIFNTAGLAATWQTGGPWLFGVAVNATRASAANGIGDAANYRQLALQQSYWLSKRTAIYLLQSIQSARGLTLAADGASLIGAVAVIGDSQASSPSSDGRQKVFMAGLRHAF